MSSVSLSYELLGFIIGILGGFLSGVIIKIIPGKIRMVLLLDGKLLSKEGSDAEFIAKVREMRYPKKFLFIQVILLLFTLFGVYYFTIKSTILAEYLFILNLIFALAAFIIGLLLAILLGNKISIDATLTKEAYKAFMRKAVTATQIPSTLE